jgi:hypothetical protein
MILRNNGFIKPQSVQSRDLLFSKIREKYSGENWGCNYIDKIKNNILNFTIMVARKWHQSNRKYDKFIKKNNNWLETIFKLPLSEISSNKSKGNSMVGHPSKSFLECREKTKKMKVQSLVKLYTSPELVYVVLSKFQKSGKRDAAQILKEVTESPTRAAKYKKSLNHFDRNIPILFTCEEALAFMVQNKLTKQ